MTLYQRRRQRARRQVVRWALLFIFVGLPAWTLFTYALFLMVTR